MKNGRFFWENEANSFKFIHCTFRYESVFQRARQRVRVHWAFICLTGLTGLTGLTVLTVVAGHHGAIKGLWV